MKNYTFGNLYEPSQTTNDFGHVGFRILCELRIQRDWKNEWSLRYIERSMKVSIVHISYE